jgi:beta-mannosidase
VHGPWEHMGLGRHTQHYDAGTAKLHSEFGVEGMTNGSALEALIAPEHRWPADRSNPVYEHLGAWWDNEPFVQECFGGRLKDVELLRRASQWLQYEGLRYAVEANLRRGAGTIPWQFNESYPNAWCTAAVDWHGRPKPAYWGVARAYRPNHVSASFATWAWAGRPNVQAQLWAGAQARIVDVHGRLVADGPTAPLDAIETDVFLLDLEGRNRYVMTRAQNLEPLLDLEPAAVEADVGDAAVTLRNSGSVAAIGIVLESATWTLFEDNVIDLLPGETRAIAVSWAGERELRVEGWNVRA